MRTQRTSSFFVTGIRPIHPKISISSQASLSLFYIFVCASLITYERSGGLLLFHIVSNTVPSADQGLTIVFGMGTGVSPDRIATGN